MSIACIPSHSACWHPPLTYAASWQDCKEKRSFFNWFYLSINVGSLIACTVIVYIQDSLSWAIGFAIPAIAMALAVAVFVGGSPLYTHITPTERCLPMSIASLHGHLARIMLWVETAWLRTAWPRVPCEHVHCICTAANSS